MVSTKVENLSKRNNFVSQYFLHKPHRFGAKWNYSFLITLIYDWNKNHISYEKMVWNTFVYLFRTKNFVSKHVFHIAHRFGAKYNFFIYENVYYDLNKNYVSDQKMVRCKFVLPLEIKILSPTFFSYPAWSFR